MIKKSQKNYNSYGRVKIAVVQLGFNHSFKHFVKHKLRCHQFANANIQTFFITNKLCIKKNQYDSIFTKKP